MPAPKYKRVLLKISGEGLCRAGGFGIDGEELRRIGNEIKLVAELGVQLCVVIGGGNIVRGSLIAKDSFIDVATRHCVGMSGTVISALAIQEALESLGVLKPSTQVWRPAVQRTLNP